MSGYRSLHREQVIETAIWKVKTSHLLTSSRATGLGWRIWIACADGLVRSYVVKESSITTKKESLDASALSLICTHQLGDVSPLGCSRVSLTRNYVGDDDQAGDLIVASLELAGLIRVWSFEEKLDNDVLQKQPESPVTVKPMMTFDVENATGSILELCSPRLLGASEVAAAVGCLDGTISIVSVGIGTPKTTKEPSVAGTTLEVLGHPGSAIPLCMAWHPQPQSCCVCAVGRQDGVVDLLATGHSKKQHQHRLTDHTATVRAISFTPDGHLLIAGSDNGFVCVWDVSRKVPTLVHHILHAHKSWIMEVTALNDSRRFATVGAEQQIHVWSFDQIYQPVHTFQTDHMVWGFETGPQNHDRLVTCSDEGGVHIFSIN